MEFRHKLVVFDLDGTLINSLPDISAAGNKMLAGYGRKPHTIEEYKYFVGNGSKKLVERITQRRKDNPEYKQRHCDASKKYYQKRKEQADRPVGTGSLLHHRGRPSFWSR